MKKSKAFWLLFLVLFLFSSPAWGARLKDIASFKGIRSNQLVGYGLVVGLNKTGDDATNSEFTTRTIVNMLQRMGIQISNDRISQLKLKNIAGVMVTCHPSSICPEREPNRCPRLFHRGRHQPVRGNLAHDALEGR